MRRKLRKLLSTLLALTMVLSLLPVSALADEQPDVKYGSITNGAWTEVPGATGEITTGLPVGVSKVSKQAVKTGDNTYQVTLTVEMSETTTTTPPDSVATVLVMDTSGSMGWCANCGETCTCSTQSQWVEATTIDTGKTYYIQSGRRYIEVNYCSGKHSSGSECEGGAGWYTSSSRREHTDAAKITPKTADTTDGTQFYERMSITVPTRLDGAKAAAIDFLKSYSGFSADSFDTSGNVKSDAINSASGRYVALVEFANFAETKQSWVDVATVGGYQAVFAQINGFVAGGGTNLDAGFRVADVLLQDTTVSSIAAKNVIALTDGEPTYYLKRHEFSLFDWFADVTIGGVGYCQYGNGSSCNSDTFTATISTAATVKTSAKLYTICFGAGTDTMNNPDGGTITLENYLSQKIATSAADAYTADTSAQLSAAFKAISSTITSGLNSGAVTDSLPSSAVTAGAGFAANWSLTKDSASKVTVGDTTTYTWTKSYTVTIDPTKTNGQDYYPLNGRTQLVVDGTTIDFPIPAGQVKYPAVTGAKKELVTANPSGTGIIYANYDNSKIENNKIKADVGATVTLLYKITVEGGAGASFTVTDANTTLVYPATGVTANNGVYTGTVGSAGKTEFYVSKAFANVTDGQALDNTITVDGVENPQNPTSPTVDANKYTVTYDWGTDNIPAEVTLPVDNNTYKTGETYPINASYSAATAVVDGGYTYEFSGWKLNGTLVTTDQTMGSANVTLTGAWTKTVNNNAGYTVHYYEENSTNKVADDKIVQSLSFGSSHTESAPAVAGYTAVAPTTQSVTAGYGVEITFYYKANEYQITYDLTGGSLEAGKTNPSTYTVKTPTFTLNNPTKAGHTFKGWTGTGLTVATETVSVSQGSTGNRHYVATWEANAAKIVFEENGGSEVADMNGTTGQAITDTVMPTTTRTGYNFAGWYANSELSGDAVTALPTVFPAGTTTYYAKWTATVTGAKKELVTSAPAGLTIPEGTTITYPVSNKISADKGDKVTLLYKITVTGGAGAAFEVTDANTTLVSTAVVTENNGVYTGNVGSDGVTEFYVTKTFTITGTAGETLGNKITVSTPGVTPQNPDDVKVETKKYDVTYSYTGTVPANAPALPKGDKYAKGAEVNVAADPTLAGYVFSGWSAAGVTIEDGKFTMPGNNVGLSGSWSAADAPYKVEYYLEETVGGTYKLMDDEQYTRIVTGKKTDDEVSEAPKSITGYVFDSSVEGTLTNGRIPATGTLTLKLYYSIDKIGGENGKTPGGSDGTPDKYQAVVTYKVVNGTWSDKSETDKQAIFTLKTKSETTGKWVEADPTPTLGDSIPTGMIANEHYTDETAGWDAVAPSSSTEVKGDATYTYRFIKVGSATFDPDNAPFDNGDDGVSYQPIFYKKLTGILPGPETFQITLTEVNENNGDNIEINPDADNKFDVVKPAVYTGTVTMSAAGRMAFNCETMTFDQPGYYVFSVKETEGDKSYIDYDDAEYELIIEVGYPGVEWASAQSEQESEETAQLEILHWFVQSVRGEMAIEGQLEIDFNNSSSYTPSVTPVIPDPTVKVKGLDTINHVAYIVGRNTGLVDPNGTITRAEVATIYFRLMTEEFRNQFWSDKCSYTDVADTAWYNVAISTLENAGVIKDTVTGGSFRPNDPITRAELAVMAAQFCTVTGNIPRASFTDIPYTYWAAKEIALVEYAGWIEGYNGKFRPDDNLTRAECVTIVNRMLNRGAEPENMLKNMVIFPDNLNVDVWYYAAIQEAANSHTYTRTGKLLTGEHFNGEKWTALQAAPDWAAMEQAWANANRK